MSNEQTLESLGKLIDGNSYRDAVHIAVAPIKATASMHPGEHAGIGGNRDNPIGVVDPFLREAVPVGATFWLFLYPNSITSLKHLWTHPVFDQANKAASEAWLRNFIQGADCPDYDTVLSAASGLEAPPDEDYGRPYYIEGEYLHFNGRDAHGEIPNEFWDHVQTVTGKVIRRRPQYFSCSC